MKPIDLHTATKYYWGEDCESFILVDIPALSVKQELMPSGTSEKLHFHNQAQQFFYILKGEAVFKIDNEILKLKQNQGICIEPKKEHLIENNTGDKLEFLVISQPNTNNDRINIEQPE